MSSLTVVCITTVSRRASAQRATATLRVHHPDADVHTIAVDDVVTDPGVRFVETLFPPREFGRLAMLHHDDSLIVAVRPTVLRAVLREASRFVLVLPDDAEVFGPLDALLAPLVDGAAISLVRNRFAPPPADGQLPDSIDVARLGRIDQDLLALRAGDTRADDVLDAWVSVLGRSPHVPLQRLDPMEHPWLDSFTERDGVALVVDPAMPLSVRNADEPARAVSPHLVRWPAFDPSTPWILSAETGTLPRVRPTTHPRLGSLARDRASALAAFVDDGRVGAFTHLPNGMAVDEVLRRAYASGLVRFESGNDVEPPNPFAGDSGQELIEWLATPRGTALSPFVAAFREVHPELDHVLPDDRSLVNWIVDRGAVAGIPSQFRLPPQTADGPSPLGPGLEISGYLDAFFGMGEAARALLQGCADAGIATRVTVDPRTAHRRSDAEPPTSGGASSATTPSTFVAVRNADALIADPSDVIEARASGRRVVGYWFWEVATFPDRLRPAFDLVDEVWVATEFVANAIRSTTGAPLVRLLPHPLPTPVSAEELSRLRSKFARAHTISDDRFVVSFSFDYDSVADRKNPWGAIEAYRTAFPEVGGQLADGRVPLLVLKAIGAQRHPTDHDRLLHTIGERTDVLLIERHLEPDLQRGLFARSDAYVSLHRGEGLGLTLAEAMAAGCPVVCTGYGGNMSFCTDDTVFVVPHVLVDIPRSTPVYAGCGTWAEPSTAVAAAHLRLIAEAPATAALKASAATQHLVDLHTERSQALAAFLSERAAHGTPPAPPTPAPHTAPAPASTPPTEEPPMTEGPDETAPGTTIPLPATHPGLGPVVLPGAVTPNRSAGSGVLSAVTDRVRSTVEPLIAAQAAFEQARVVALVDAVQQTRQAVLDIEANAKAERETLTGAITGAAAHTANLQANHDSLYASVTDLSTQVRTLTDSHLDLHAAIKRLDRRLDLINADLRVLLDRFPRSAGD